MSDLLSRVIGHRATLDRLQSMLSGERVPHSFLFVGPEGQGKKLVARAMAQILMCEKKTQKDRACGQCGHCRGVENNSHIGLFSIEPEKNVIKIEAARNLLRQLSLAQLSAARVVIVDGAQYMNPQATNALLKCVEEPPPNTYFIFITPSQNSIMGTIRSRSQIVRFATLKSAELRQLPQSAEADSNNESPQQIWSALLQQQVQVAIETCREQVANRESALLCTREWLRYVRDSWHSYQESWPKEKLARLSEIILAMESDLHGHCDLQLTLENGLNEMSEAL